MRIVMRKWAAAIIGVQFMREKKTSTKTRQPDPARGRTQVKGQNPKADDSPDHDEHHDENRRNLYDPEVGEALALPNRRSQSKK